MVDWITEEIAEIIRGGKKGMPHRFSFRTMSTDELLIIHVPKNHFETFNIQEQIKIVEGINEIAERIRTTGCPVSIYKY